MAKSNRKLNSKPLSSKKNVKSKHSLSTKKPVTKSSTKPSTNNNRSSKSSAVVTRRPPCPVHVNNWRAIQTIGEKQCDIMELFQQPWEFLHLRQVLQTLLVKHPSGRLFVFGSQPHPYNTRDGKPKYLPTLCVIHVPQPPASENGEVDSKLLSPPPVVSLQNPQRSSDSFHSMGRYNLSWAPMNGLANNGRVFALQQTGTLTRSGALEFEYVTLFTMVPSKDIGPRKSDGTIDIQFAPFKYVADGQVIEEDYTKNESNYADICERFDLDVDTHRPKVKETVKQAFVQRRLFLESRLNRLKDHGYTEDMLENIRVVAKIYPRNDEVQGLVDEGMVLKDPLVNQYYGDALEIF